MARRNRVMPTQKVIPTQTVIVLSLSPEEHQPLGAAVNIMNQTIFGRRRRMTAAGTKPEAADTQPGAAVAATDKVAGEAEEMPPRHTMCLRGKAAAEVTPWPNEDLAAVPNGAIQGPPSRTHLEERGRRDGRVTGVREEGARATIEAGVATPYRADSLPLPLRRPAAVTKHTFAVANHEAAVAAMQGASVAIPLPLLLLGEPALEAAVAAMKGATPGPPRSMSRLRTGS